MKINVVERILEANERIARQNKKTFEDEGVFVINLMSSPGAGKTSLIESTVRALSGKFKTAVIEGDIQGTADSERIGALGIPVVQINTGGACHLDANMVAEALKGLSLGGVDLLIIENVGNLVCPAEFHLGEHMKVMLLGITEGHDKPLKYPLMFRESKALLLNKTDLKPHLDVDLEKIKRDSLSLNPSIEILEISCKTGSGIDEWTEWLCGHIRKDS